MVQRAEAEWTDVHRARPLLGEQAGWLPRGLAVPVRAHGEEETDRVRAQPTRSKLEGEGRRCVQPLEIVDRE
jgi:hypothetical protein